MPGAASASDGGAATLGGGSTTPLTVDFYEPGFVSQLNQYNAATGSMGSWFQLSGDAQHQAESPMGPANPQALNRYSYTLNNPLRYTDPTGHCPWCVGAVLGALGGLAYYAYTHHDNFNIWEALQYAGVGAVIGGGFGWLVGGGAAWIGSLLGLGEAATEKLLPSADDLSWSGTVASHYNELSKAGTWARPYMHYGNWQRIVQWIMDSGTPIADPQEAPGALRWDVEGTLNESSGMWELVVDTQNNRILHWLFRSTK
ncbi:MAG: hypothetical protein H0X37_04455 [Herpetosiphonaceae bacterium]|nr:hypothetical protein [Herpetosiphonaceae bacterium]